jgi:hypothetical protein
VLPPAMIDKGLAFRSDAAAFATETGVELPVAPVAILNDTVARDPLPMPVVLMPETMHRTSPAEMIPQMADFPDPLAPVPVA